MAYPKILVAPVFWFLYPRLKGHSRNRTLMRFECEGRVIQLRNLDPILSSTRPVFGGAKKRAAFLGGLSLLLPGSYRWIDQLITTNLVSHPVTCVIDRYIHIYVR